MTKNPGVQSLVERRPREGDSERVEFNTMTPHSQAEGRGPGPAVRHQGRASRGVQEPGEGKSLEMGKKGDSVSGV